MTTESPGPSTRRWIVLGATSAVALLVAVGVALTARNDPQVEPPPPTTPSSADSTAGAPTASRSEPETEESLITGIDGWLMFAEDVDPDCALLDSFPGVERLGRPPEVLRYIVNQPKSAFHPERVELDDRPDPCVAVSRAALRQRFRTDPAAIEADDALERELEAGSEIFFRSDTHWLPEGRIAAAEAIIEELSPGLWDPDSVVTADQPYLNDLGSTVGIEVPATISGPTVDRGPVTVLDERTSVIGDLSFVTFFRSRSAAERVIPGVTYLLADSQMGYLLPEIGSYFEELVFINWFLFEVGSTDYGASPDPARIVVQSIERDAVQRFNDPVLDVLVTRLDG